MVAESYKVVQQRTEFLKEEISRPIAIADIRLSLYHRCVRSSAQPSKAALPQLSFETFPVFWG